MKEYKVVILKLGFSKRHQRLEEILNQYSREGWQLNHMAQNRYNMILERDKNR